jgi:hypothetical protein
MLCFLRALTGRPGDQQAAAGTAGGPQQVSGWPAGPVPETGAAGERAANVTTPLVRETRQGPFVALDTQQASGDRIFFKFYLFVIAGLYFP